jgi:hypothetical protein
MSGPTDEPGADPVSPEALSVEEQRRRLPDQPGVYLFKDPRGRVLYVGKATAIRKRVAGHFAGKSTSGGGEMVSRIASIASSGGPGRGAARRAAVHQRHRRSSTSACGVSLYVGISSTRSSVYHPRRHRSGRILAIICEAPETLGLLSLFRVPDL